MIGGQKLLDARNRLADMMERSPMVAGSRLVARGPERNDRPSFSVNTPRRQMRRDRRF